MTFFKNETDFSGHVSIVFLERLCIPRLKLRSSIVCQTFVDGNVLYLALLQYSSH